MKYIFLNFLNKFFTKVNLSKIIVIFFVGFFSRVLVSYYLDLSVVIDFLNPFSIIYYILYAIFIVFINELFSTFSISIFPELGYCSFFSNVSGIFIKIYVYNINIYNIMLKSIKDGFDDITLLYRKTKKKKEKKK